MRYFPFILFLTLIYLMLSSNLELLNILTGVLISIGTTYLLKPRIKPWSWRRIPTTIFALLKYLGILIYDIIKGGLIVAKSVWSPNYKIDPAITKSQINRLILELTFSIKLHLLMFVQSVQQFALVKIPW